MRPEVLLWLEQSKADFRSAKNSFTSQDYYVSVFLCQQSVEKALKAVFIETKKEPAGKSPSLFFFAKQVGVPDKFMEFIKNLAPEFVATRYPDIADEVPANLYSEQKAQTYLKQTEDFLEWINSQLN